MSEARFCLARIGCLWHKQTAPTLSVFADLKRQPTQAKRRGVFH